MESSGRPGLARSPPPSVAARPAASRRQAHRRRSGKTGPFSPPVPHCSVKASCAFIIGRRSKPSTERRRVRISAMPNRPGHNGLAESAASGTGLQFHSPPGEQGLWRGEVQGQAIERRHRCAGRPASSPASLPCSGAGPVDAASAGSFNAGPAVPWGASSLTLRASKVSIDLNFRRGRRLLQASSR